MNILITGSNGLIGGEIAKRLGQCHKVIGCGTKMGGYRELALNNM